MIGLSCVIRATYYRKFLNKLSEVIYVFEREGYEVDIKYSPLIFKDQKGRNRIFYTALVLGREKE